MSDNGELRERVARTIQTAEAYEFAWGDYLEIADAVLVALGLNDLDAAAGRALTFLKTMDWWLERSDMVRGLEAALTPPEGDTLHGRPTGGAWSGDAEDHIMGGGWEGRRNPTHEDET